MSLQETLIDEKIQGLEQEKQALLDREKKQVEEQAAFDRDFIKAKKEVEAEAEQVARELAGSVEGASTAIPCPHCKPFTYLTAKRCGDRSIQLTATPIILFLKKQRDGVLQCPVKPEHRFKVL